MQVSTNGLRIHSEQQLVTPNELHHHYPITTPAANTVTNTRAAASHILAGTDSRLVVIIGPCSIHDPNAAREYADKLKAQADIYADDLLIIMRTYLEKPRTTVGWKGILSDPYLDGSFDINYGLTIARELLLDINHLGLPTATEFLDTVSPPYFSDLISWAAIGARTTQSQVHRELASGLSMPVGFKNTTDGNVRIAIDAVLAARHAHHFLGISKAGTAAILATTGNENCHIILRGATDGPNYSNAHVQTAISALQQADLSPRLMIDCSHGNSMKNHTRQQQVVDSIVTQRRTGTQEIVGVMLESNLIAGKQTYLGNKNLAYGQSITDACIDWAESVVSLEKLATATRASRTR